MSEPLRLILITPDITSGGGGVSEVVRLLAHTLAKNDDIRVEVVALATPRLDESRAGWPDIPINVFRTYGPRKYGFSPGMAWYLLRRRADLAHLHGIWMFPVLATYLWKIRWKAPVIVTPHGMLEHWIMQRSRRLKAAVSALYQRSFLRKAEAIQVLTAKEREDVQAAIGQAHCIEIPNFLPEFSTTSVVPKWYVSDSGPRKTFLFLGRIHEKKGWRALCSAWDAQCRSDPTFSKEAQLVFCGWQDGSEDFPDVIQDLIQSHGNVVYAGPQYGIQKLASLAVSSYFILSSESEGLPMVVLEAWASGLPVIMSRACNLNIGFASGAAIEIGTTVPEIKAGLASAFALPEDRRRQMGRAGEDLVAAHFSETVVMTDLLKLYRQLAP